VISGSARGRHLATPKGARIRPTADRVKEALFSILNSLFGSLGDVSIIDICAGTGSLGIEALSRGAAQAVFVDNHPESVALIKQNLRLTGFTEQSQLLSKDAGAAIATLARGSTRFQLVFLDPPYQQGLVTAILGQLAESPLLVEGAVVVAEFATREEIPAAYGTLEEVDRRTYGDTTLSFLVRRASCDA
jgi:16S rRNA (guanine(966)-N(2))-methyltransferase RsmD